MKTTAIGILLGLLLCGCSTPYERVDPEDGKTYRNIEGDKYEVTYYGDNIMGDGKNQDYCLLSCAEVTKILGYEYFTVIKREKVARHKTIKFFDPYQSYKAQYNPVVDDRDIPEPYQHPHRPNFQVQIAGYKFVILCSSANPSGRQTPNVYAANEVLDRISKKYGIKMAKTVAGGDTTS